MTPSLWRHHILPFTLLLGLLAVATLAGDAFRLHRLDLVWVGRYLGIPGTIMIIGSLVYSLRKRSNPKGNPKSLLKLHEFSAWLGSLMVLLHAGVHFNAILPWLATVASGGECNQRHGWQAASGLFAPPCAGPARAVPAAWVVTAEGGAGTILGRGDVEAMTKWRKVHIPIFIAFAVLSLGHIISIFLFWGWI